jgi:serine/threonine protein kinase/lipoprotein NlpI
MTDLEHPLSDGENNGDGDRAGENNFRKILKGRYQILTQLGEDRISKTYLAKDLENAETIQCIVRHFPFDRSQDRQVWQEVKNYFLQSKVILNRLGNHEQIPTLLDNFEEEEEFYLILEYIEGINFQERVRDRTLTESEIIFFLCDVLKLLNFVHGNNLIHGNIKPENLIFRNTDKKLFLVDFQLCPKTSDSIFKEELSINIEKSISTRKFSLSEQFDRTNSINDIYALGRTAIYGLIGRSLSELEDSKTGQLINWHYHCQVDLKLRSILNKMTAPQVRDRYQCVSDILEDLQPLLLIGKTLIGRYEIKNYLGGERLINTFLAKQLWQQENKYCLVKQINFSQKNSAFIREIEFYLAKFLEDFINFNNYSQIQKSIDRFEYDRKFYLVQEFIEGTSLEETLEIEQNLDIERVILLLQEVLEILKKIHQPGIIHQNIKPSNIIRRSSDRKIVLTDFGAIETIVDNLNNEKSSSNFNAYAAPEQLVGRPTFSSDIYALGTIAVRALTGINPQKLRTRWNFQKIIWQSDLQIDFKLKTILNKMIDSDLSQRYQSAQKALEDLQKFRIKSSERTRVKESVSLNSKLSLKNYRSLHRFSIFRFKYIGCAIFAATILLIINEYLKPSLQPLIYLYLGEISIEKQPQEALDRFQKAIDFDPQIARAWQGRGNSLARLRRFREALSAYDEAIDLNPKNIENWQYKADALLNLQEFDEAIKIYDRLLTLNPQASNILQKKGKALANLERDREALAAQQQAIDIDPNNVEAISDLGKTLIKLRQYKDALINFDKAQYLEPQQPKLWQDRAIALGYLNRPQARLNAYNEALNIYNESLKIHPENFDNWMEKGKILANLERYPEAIKAYHRAIGLNPNSARVWQAKGEIFVALGNLKKALEAFDRALSLVPKSYSVLRDRGLILSQEKRYDEAIVSFQKAIDINPNDYKSWLGKGLAFASLQQRQEALIAFDRAAEIMPQDTSVWLERGTILARWGKYAKACDSFERATAIDPLFSPAIEASKQINCSLFEQ